MEDVIWQFETIQFIGTVVVLFLALSCFFVVVVNSWQIVEDIYRLVKDGIRAKRTATVEDPFMISWEEMRRSLSRIAFMAFTVIVSGVVGNFFMDLFTAYVIAKSGG